jgi:hypothetical protein
MPLEDLIEELIRLSEKYDNPLGETEDQEINNDNVLSKLIALYMKIFNDEPWYENLLEGDVAERILTYLNDFENPVVTILESNTGNTQENEDNNKRIGGFMISNVFTEPSVLLKNLTKFFSRYLKSYSDGGNPLIGELFIYDSLMHELKQDEFERPAVLIQDFGVEKRLRKLLNILLLVRSHFQECLKEVQAISENPDNVNAFLFTKKNSAMHRIAESLGFSLIFATENHIIYKFSLSELFPNIQNESRLHLYFFTTALKKIFIDGDISNLNHFLKHMLKKFNRKNFKSEPPTEM